VRDGEGPNARTDFQQVVFQGYFGGIRDGVTQRRVDQEVLSEPVLEVNAMATQETLELARVCRIDHEGACRGLITSFA
jgi:hypothetical protein